MLSWALLSTGFTDSEITGAGTCIELDLLHLRRVHATEASDLVALLGAAVHDRAAAPEPALVDAQVGELTVAAVLELEGERHQRLVRVRGERDRRLVVREVDARVLDLGGIRQVAGHRVQQRLYALVLVGRSQKDGCQLLGDRAAANRLANERLGHLLLEDRLGQIVREERDRIEHGLARGLGLALQLGGDRVLADLFAVVALEVDRLHRDQVDHALVLALQTDRELHEHGVVLELFAELFHHALGVCARAIELVDEGEARDLVAPHLAVDGHRLGLHTRHAAQHQDGAVEHAQRALHLDREVDVTRRVDDVDVVLVPLAVGGRRGDRDAALALELHEVHGGAHLVLPLHLVDAVNPLGVEEDALGERCLARVDVRADPDVADLREVVTHRGLAYGGGLDCERSGGEMSRWLFGGSGCHTRRPLADVTGSFPSTALAGAPAGSSTRAAASADPAGGATTRRAYRIGRQGAGI
jgi:hypothetical protein